MTLIIAVFAAAGVFAVVGFAGLWAVAVYDRGRAVVAAE